MKNLIERHKRNKLAMVYVHLRVICNGMESPKINTNLYVVPRPEANVEYAICAYETCRTCVCVRFYALEKSTVYIYL